MPFKSRRQQEFHRFSRPAPRWCVGAIAWVGLVGTAGPVSAQTAQPSQRESIYAPPAPPRDDQGVNEGAVHIDLAVSYLTDNIWRGIERFEYDPSFPRSPSAPPPPDPSNRPKEDLANLQFDGTLRFDLGKLPSPFVRLFVNVAEDSEGDDSGSFQEIRPILGFDWNLRPLKLSVAHINYIFPEDETDANGVPESAEIVGRIELDDSYFFRTERPVLSPYVFAAYDYDEFDGLYLEAGVSHTLPIEDTPITLTFEGHVAYASGLSEMFGSSAGFQHYQVGLVADYSLNALFNLSRRYGEWSFRGYLYYTGEMDEDMRVDDQIWGGAGIGFSY